MRSVTRKAAITAGLGAAIAAGAAGSASATPVTDLVDELAPAASTAQAAMPDAAAPFPLTQVTDKLPVGQALTPGQGPLDGLATGVAHGMARDMEQNMGDMAAQSGPAKGGLGSPLNALPTDKLTGAGGTSPLSGLPL
ncbi:hypothetical protein [Embleya hyalina]|uniref:ATP-binding protein n=1 Tax=Embleya hyalina TaxID=516124 RepID=A0A401YL92_9ACTN|nr:hypothetical protein [Embleya hyalina]GCD95366.1 hypothetical protein EHYA_03038 [Embleya hyalina]